jgi:hypothetical protein
MMAALITTAGTSFGQGAVQDLVEERFADDDARTKAWLDRLVKIGGRCRYCGATVGDRMLALHPEVCGSTPCVRRARKEGFVSDLGQVTRPTLEAVEPPGRPDREVAGPRGQPAVAAHQSPGAPTTPSDDEDEIMPESEETEKKLCTKCHVKPIRRDNESGICTVCRYPWRKNGATAKNGTSHETPRLTPKNGVATGCDPSALSDDDLALCIAEARARVRSRERLAEILAGEG